LIKTFASLVSLLILMVLTMGVHTYLFPYDDHTRSLQSLTKLTHNSNLSLSVAYDESTLNDTYPEMPALGRMDFVYER